MEALSIPDNFFGDQLFVLDEAHSPRMFTPANSYPASPRAEIAHGFGSAPPCPTSPCAETAGEERLVTRGRYVPSSPVWADTANGEIQQLVLEKHSDSEPDAEDEAPKPAFTLDDIREEHVCAFIDLAGEFALKAENQSGEELAVAVSLYMWVKASKLASLVRDTIRDRFGANVFMPSSLGVYQAIPAEKKSAITLEEFGTWDISAAINQYFFEDNCDRLLTRWMWYTAAADVKLAVAYGNVMEIRQLLSCLAKHHMNDELVIPALKALMRANMVTCLERMSDAVYSSYAVKINLVTSQAVYEAFFKKPGMTAAAFSMTELGRSFVQYMPHNFDRIYTCMQAIASADAARRFNDGERKHILDWIETVSVRTVATKRAREASKESAAKCIKH